ncbi:hypothetical protein KM043_013175 [Ampulex compressa]|nr:hypothetical protein KM043_013175 [Ampulex compressa]
MASAKFLEEALSTDVDESANHQTPVSGISNGGAASKHVVSNGPASSGQEPAKPLLPSSTTCVTSQVGSTFATQQSTQQHVPSLAKSHEPVKIIYPTVGQVITTTNVANNKLSFPTPPVGQLANGALGIASQAVLQTGQAGVGKQTGTALVIKTSVAPGGMVSVPMSVPVSVGGNVILNVNAMRPGTPVSAQPAGKQVTPRVVIGPHMVGARPGAPGITLQALHGLQPGTQGHLLLKTENGQYQLLRVGPAPAAGTPTGTAVTPNSIAGNAVVAAPSPGTTYRLASVPATVATTITTASTTPPTVTTAGTTTSASTVATIQTVQTSTPRQTTDNTKEKCRKFLANLLELSSREPKAVERNVRTLIQELIDTKVEPEEFCDRLERLLNASPQPCLIGFLKKSLPLLRQSLVTKELVIDGIRPPPANVVFSIASATPTVTQSQLRPTVAVAATVPMTAVTATTQVRVMAPIPAATTTVPRPAQPVQQRLIRPVTTVVRTPTAYTVKSTVATAGGIRPAAPAIQKSAIATTISKPITTTAQGRIVNATTTINKTVVPSLVPKPTAKEKEKKTFSSAGYTGDDDINDVAAMGGVNLAEESQRILGSTEFVGTQIRSCKDEVFLHMTPLQQRIKQIVSNYGLEEPNQEVAALISHAAQERLKNLVEKLAVIAEHRIDLIKVDPRYEVTQDVRAQLKFLEDLDRVERRRHEEQERELLLRAAKSRAKTEDPEQAKLKAKAKEMQRAEMEELRQREANLTALQAIGPRKKPKLDVGGTASSPGSNSGLNASTIGISRQIPMRPRLKRVNFRDLLFLLEQEKETCRSTTLYKSYLK